MVEWHYEGLCTLPTKTQVPSAILDEWADTLIAESVRIKASMNTKIPDNAKFLSRIATPSSDRYAEFLSEVGGAWDKDDILLRQKLKLKRAYEVWSSSVDECFKVGGYFAGAVTAKKPKVAQLRYVLGAVGHKPSADDPLYGVWNPVVMGVLLLRGDSRPLRYMTSGQDFWTLITSFQGALKAQEGALVSPSIIADGVRGAVWSQYLLEAGQETDITAYLATINARIETLITLAKKTGAVASHVLSWDATDVVKVTTELTTPPS